MCTYLIKKINKSVFLFLSFENIIFVGHVKTFQNHDSKNLTHDTKKNCHPLDIIYYKF